MNINEFCEAVESFNFPTVTLYHGSNKKYDMLQPVALDLGNTFQKPGWSIFCWDNYKAAYSWSVMRGIGLGLTKLRENNEISRVSDYIVWDPKRSLTIVSETKVHEFKEILKKYNIDCTGYVYTFKVPINKISIGNDSGHKEYTTREKNIVPIKIDEVHIDWKNFNKFVNIVPDTYYNKIANTPKEKWKWFNRGLVSLFITNEWTYNVLYNKSTIRKIRSDMRDGSLNPGDDIEKYLSDNNLEIKKLTPLKRIKYQIGGNPE